MTASGKAGTHPVQISFGELGLVSSDQYEHFAAASASRIERRVLRRDGRIVVSSVRSKLLPSERSLPADEHFDLSWLRARQAPNEFSAGETLRVADLFCGCGGMSLGVAEALSALGMNAEFAFACDTNTAALDVYRTNFAPVMLSETAIETLVDGNLGTPPTETESELKQKVGQIDFLIAGPPCQGHSDLNNHTRRKDPKNQLLLRAIRFVEMFRPRFVLIENVQGIRHDRMGSLTDAKQHLRRLGYSFEDGLVRAEQVGVPQTRRRYFLFATIQAARPFDEMMSSRKNTARTVGWAIGDLVAVQKSTIFDTASNHSAENKRRIDYLFDHELYELPDAQRPYCHKSGGHGYTAVYGRMRWDRPAPTITTGFGSAGQGRFVHPQFRRTLTPHEAARIQFFPDFFRFGVRGRRQFQELIGNAVPPKLAYAVVLHQLR